MLTIRSFPRKSLRWWKQHEAAIDFDPAFQRTSHVWNDREKAFLIDSIINGFDIPKIYIADHTIKNIPELNIHHKSYAIIDGKQRLSAILQFYKDRLPLSRHFYHPSVPNQNLGGLRYSALKKNHPQICRLIDKYVLDVKAIVTTDGKLINEAFLRLNKASKALNGAEIRNAMHGKAVEAIRTLGTHRFFVRRIRFGTDRGQERNAAAKLLVLEYLGGPAETKKRNLDAFVNEIGENASGRFTKTIARVKANLTVLSSVFQNHDPLLGTQGYLPLYYLFITRLRHNDRKKVRTFLAVFEKERVANRRRQPSHRNGALDEYDLASRSTNDKASYKTRLLLVRQTFARWKKTGLL